MQRKNCGYISSSSNLVTSFTLVRTSDACEYAHSITASLRTQPRTAGGDLKADTNKRIRAFACSSSVRATVTNFVPC